MGTVPTPPTFGPGETTGVSAKLNLLRDVQNFILNPPRCSAYHGTSANVPNNTATALALDSELFDVVMSGDSPSHDNVTANTRLVCRTAGTYEIVGAIRWVSNATGIREAQVRLNGTTTLIKNAQNPSASSSTDCATPPIEVALSPGDYIELLGYQTSGGALATVIGREVTFLRFKLTGA